MDKYIFLDIDGVISIQKSRYALDKGACDLLGKIISATDAKIVVTSTWRQHTVEATKQYLTTVGHLVPFPFPYADRIVGITARGWTYVKAPDDEVFRIPRGMEIKHWIDNKVERDENHVYNGKKPGIDYNYVILDDDSDMLLGQAGHFVKTDPYDGLSEKDVKKAIRILNSKRKNGQRNS